MTLRELRLLEAAEAVVSSWEVYRDDLFRSENALRHEDGMVCALERLDDALDPYHLPGDGGE
jgi:hypothetical protein